MVPGITPDEAEEIATWWWEEHRQATRPTSDPAAPVSPAGELDRICRIVARSQDHYGIADDVMWRLHAATTDTVWTLLEELLPADVTRNGAHIGGTLDRLVLDPVISLIGDPDRIVACGPARILAAELFDRESYADHVTERRFTTVRLNLTCGMVGIRRTLWLLALRAATIDPLRPPLPLWRYSVAALADRARRSPITDHEAGHSTNPDRRQWLCTHDTLDRALRTPWKLTGEQVAQLTSSAALADASADVSAHRRQKLGGDIGNTTIALDLYL